MKKKMMFIALFLVLALCLCAFTPGGRGRIPVPPQYVTVTLTADSGSPAVTATPGMVRMPPRLRGTPLPPFCNQPGGPRC